jgi:hypothetical protein
MEWYQFINMVFKSGLAGSVDGEQGSDGLLASIL